jgi:hypothetical protein
MNKVAISAVIWAAIIGSAFAAEPAQSPPCFRYQVTVEHNKGQTTAIVRADLATGKVEMCAQPGSCSTIIPEAKP